MYLRTLCAPKKWANGMKRGIGKTRGSPLKPTETTYYQPDGGKAIVFDQCGSIMSARGYFLGLSKCVSRKSTMVVLRWSMSPKRQLNRRGYWSVTPLLPRWMVHGKAPDPHAVKEMGPYFFVRVMGKKWWTHFFHRVTPHLSWVVESRNRK